ncbi:hypothetical protein [Ruegeria marisrubri]|nr:hypothetical protein [Ruegeria marisrubri]
MLDHETFLDPPSDHPQWLPIGPFQRKMGVSKEDWEDSSPNIGIELRKGRRDLLRAILKAAERLEHYSYGEAPAVVSTTPATVLSASSPLGAAVDDFIAEHSRQWAGKTIGQNRAYLNILVEYFGLPLLGGPI